MITLAGPSRSAIPISLSSRRSARRVRPRPNRAIGGSLIVRSTCLIGSLTVIAHLSANSENACFLILQPGVLRCQDGAHGLSRDDERAAIPWRRGRRPAGTPPGQGVGGRPRSAGGRSAGGRGGGNVRRLSA